MHALVHHRLLVSVDVKFFTDNSVGVLLQSRLLNTLAVLCFAEHLTFETQLGFVQCHKVPELWNSEVAATLAEICA